LQAAALMGPRSPATRHFFNLGPACPSGGAQFDHLFQAGESFNIDNLNAHALAAPDHTGRLAGLDLKYLPKKTQRFFGRCVFCLHFHDLANNRNRMARKYIRPFRMPVLMHFRYN
jgi:hypothetical protein